MSALLTAPHVGHRQLCRPLSRSVSATNLDDAITPAPHSLADVTDQEDSLVCKQVCHESSPSLASTRRSSVHSGDVTETEALDADQLWKRMLAVQRVFGCYNSARMSAALSAEDDEVVGQLRPTKACLDLLNDSVVQLPLEAKEQVEKYLYGVAKTSSGK